MDSLDPRLFFCILHAFIRADSSAEEADRSASTLKWLGENMATLSRLCENAQKNLLGVIWEHWMQFKTAPSRTIVDQMTRKRDKPDAMLDLLQNYDEHKADFKPYDEHDMPALLYARKVDWEKGAVSDVLDKARRINEGSIAGKTPKDPPLSGARDALSYLFESVQNGTLVNDRKALGGSLKGSTEEIYGNYEKAKADGMENKLTIPTTLVAVDNLLGGLKRKAFWGILGYAGQRKSAVGRTISYFAAEAGFRVLHIPLESTAEEEMNIYAIMHSHNKQFKNSGFSLDINRIYEGKLTDNEEIFLRDIVLPDMKTSLKGDVIVRQPIDQTWSSIQAMIEMEHRVAPIDLVFIDYLTYIDVSAERNPIEAKNRIIAEVKRMCLTFDDGCGIAILTPVQGNREGSERAKANGGVWDKEGIGQFNEFEKTLDVCMYVFQDAELQSSNQLKIGTCKSRRSADVPVTTFIIEPFSGRVVNLTSGATEIDVSQNPDVRDSLNF